MSTPIIVAEGVSKVFRVPHERRTSIRQAVLSGFGRSGYEEFRALQDVSFEVEAGEFYGIIGRNGSGKSTMLKILAGIYQPTSGQVRVNGQLSPFIELGVGFNPELTARDNVYLNGAILGLSRQEVAAAFDEIIGFAELEQFVDQKLKNYSSGMLVRLAFSVAIRAHAEILLIDEVLAVGDYAFQQKCFDVFRRLRADGRTIVFVSHDLGSVKEFCNRVLLLDRGLPVAVDTPLGAIRRYYRLNEAASERQSAGTPGGAPQVARVEMIDASGAVTHVVRRGEDVRVVLDLGGFSQLGGVNVGVAIYRNDGLYCFGTNTFDTPIGAGEAGRLVELELPGFALQRGAYRLVVGVFGRDPSIIHDMLERAYEFQVVQHDNFEGIVHLPHRWSTR